ncbi:hypothetical protein DM01DRAFT_1336719 [Hesseltinella vesiculosa]|uniref:Uncharacterized protein n=1 Tax=Hesseltinella vesiculosa TaxID=101127 RepID=A0A1X2GF32_9FUNG|nr:hypothetical protein DM01DRAFT_1336719 [Hesseltinella vesiculosa]
MSGPQRPAAGPHQANARRNDQILYYGTRAKKNLIRHPDESTKTKLIEAVQVVVDFNTDMTIKAHLVFARYFLTTQLRQHQPSLPAAIFFTNLLHIDISAAPREPMTNKTTVTAGFRAKI